MDTAINSALLDKDILGLYNAFRKELVFQKVTTKDQYEDLVWNEDPLSIKTAPEGVTTKPIFAFNPSFS